MHKQTLTKLSFDLKQIQLTTGDINNKSREIEKFHEKIKELSSQFSTMISKNKFKKFLRKNF